MAKSVSRKKIIAKSGSSSSGGGNVVDTLPETLAAGNNTNGYDINMTNAGAGYTSAITGPNNTSFRFQVASAVAELRATAWFLINSVTSAVAIQISFVSNSFNMVFGNVAGGNGLNGTLSDTSSSGYVDNAAHNVSLSVNKAPVAGIALDINGIFNVNANSSLKIANTQLFDEIAETTYSGTITWDGTTAPTTLTNATYRWSRIGKTVTLRIHLRYTNAGVTNTNVTLTLPSGAPTPQDPSGFSAANDIAYIGAGTLGTGPGNASGGTIKAYLGPNATATGYLITINSATAVAAKVVRFEIDYFIA